MKLFWFVDEVFEISKIYHGKIFIQSHSLSVHIEPWYFGICVHVHTLAVTCETTGQGIE